MHLELLVEEESAKAALEVLIPRIVGPDHSFDIHPFRGKQDLLEKLPSRLRAYSKWIPDDWRIVVLIDEDRQDCVALKQTLVDHAARVGLARRTLCRIAVEELEAWFLGDSQAITQTFPRVSARYTRWKRFRNSDAVAGGTWEALEWLLAKNEARLPESIARSGVCSSDFHRAPRDSTSPTAQVAFRRFGTSSLHWCPEDATLTDLPLSCRHSKHRCKRQLALR